MSEIIKKYIKGDKVIWMVIFALSLISLLAVYSSTGTLAYKARGGDTFYYFLKHLIFIISGIFIIIIVHNIHYKYYSRLSQILLIITIPLLLITLLFGSSLNQAARWVTIPGIQFSFQTSDFAKLALIMYVARHLSIKQDKVDDFKTTFLPIIIPIIIVCGLIMPANFSTSAILFFTCFILLFIGRIRFRYLFLLILVGILGFALFIGVAYITNYEGRIKTWEKRIERYISGENEEDFQVEQAKIAIVNGGIFGKGPGNSRQRNFLPSPYADFIYAIIIEEYGLIGGIVILFLYLYLIFRAGVIIKKVDRTFPAFLVIGLTLSLVIQAMINMAVAVNLLPVTGQPLPLVSMGGTSVLFTCIALGIILSVSRVIQEQEIQEKLKTESPRNQKTDDNEKESQNNN